MAEDATTTQLSALSYRLSAISFQRSAISKSSCREPKAESRKPKAESRSWNVGREPLRNREIQPAPELGFEQVGVLVDVVDAVDEHEIGAWRDGRQARLKQLAVLARDHAKGSARAAVIARDQLSDPEAVPDHERRERVTGLEPVVHAVDANGGIEARPALFDDHERIDAEVALCGGAKRVDQGMKEVLPRVPFEPAVPHEHHGTAVDGEPILLRNRPKEPLPLLVVEVVQATLPAPGHVREVEADVERPAVTTRVVLSQHLGRGVVEERDLQTRRRLVDCRQHRLQ